MKSWLLSICLVVLMNLVTMGAVQAQALPEAALTETMTTEQPAPAVSPAESDSLIDHLNTNVLPQIADILTPEQCDQVTSDIKGGKSFRKAFKALALTPDQKADLAAIFKTLPKKDALAALTPDQKKQFFLKKKEGFIPTPEEIGQKISAGMKMKEQFAPAMATDAMKGKDTFKPTPEEIAKKISVSRAAKAAKQAESAAAEAAESAAAAGES